MRRNVVAAALQVVGVITAIVAGFAIATEVGLLVAGVGVFLVGVALEGDA